MADDDSTPTRSPVQIGRTMPHSIEAEEYLISCCLLDGSDVISRCMEARIRPESFYLEAHGIIFERLCDLYNRQVPTDVGVLAEDLKTSKLLDQVGGYAFLTQVSSRIPTTAQAGFFIEKVRELALLREIIRSATGAVESCYDFSGGIDEFVDQVEQKIFAVTQNRVSESAKPMREPTKEAMNVITKMMMKKGELTGVSSGFVDLDKLTWGFQRQEMIILAARPSMGKCLAADSEIVQADGSVVTIAEIYRKREAKLLTLDGSFRFRETAPSDFVDDGHKPLFRVTTRLGRTVEATAPHPFLTIDGWKSLLELAPGTAVAVPREIPVFGTEARSDAEVKILGYLIGDGTLTKSCVQFTNTNPRLREDFTAAVDEFGQCLAKQTSFTGERAETLRVSKNRQALDPARRRFTVALRQRMVASRLTDRALAERVGVSASAVGFWRQGVGVPGQQAWPKVRAFLGDDCGLAFEDIAKNGKNAVNRRIEELGLMGKKAHGKFVPAFVFRLPRPQVALFLNRLFATDGWASVSGWNASQIGLVTASSRLARQTAHLLLRFGIVASVKPRKTKYKGEDRRYYSLIVTDRSSLLSFAQEIGIFGKEEAVERVRRTAESKHAQTNADLIPVQIWSRIAELKGSESWASLGRRAGFTDSTNLHVGKRALSRGRLKQFAQALKDPGLNDLADSQVYWDEIVSIEPIGEQQVYDLTIPETHNFVANDVCVHNTSLCLGFAEAAAMPKPGKGEPVGVLVFSLEMSASQLALRMLCSRSRVNMKLLRDGLLSKNGDELNRLLQTADEFSKAPLFIDDSSSLSIMQLRAKARRLHARHKLGFVIVDYLQLMAPTDGKMPREQQVAEASRGLKALAKELDLPVLVLSQLNRASEKENRTPKLADLRESGSIEQDADIVLMLARPKDADEKFQVAADSAELIVAKQRNGPVGDLKLTFLRDITRFENYTQ